MTEYCLVSLNPSWEPDSDPLTIVNYIFESANDETKDYVLCPSYARLQITRRQESESDENQHCKVTLQCKPVFGIGIIGLSVVSESRTLEVYDALRDDSYLQTVRGTKDNVDSEADGSRVHFMCDCYLETPLSDIKIKFLSLGQRSSFEIACIKVKLMTCDPVVNNPSLSHRTIDMDKLRQDVDSMGDSVSDRARSFLTTLEKFQKSKHGVVDDLRHLLLDKNLPEAQGQSMAGITTLLSMFASSSGMDSVWRPPSSVNPPQALTNNQAEGSMMTNMLSQMMSSMAVKGEQNEKRGAVGDKGADMYRFLQSLCGQVSHLRTLDGKQGGDCEDMEVERSCGTREEPEEKITQSTAEMESRVAAKVEALVESRLSAVEEHVKEMVAKRVDELENRMESKLDAIFTLLQNAQKPS